MEPRGRVILKIAMDNIMTQWADEGTRFSGNNELSSLDLVSMKEPDIVDDLKYKSPA